MRSYLYDLETEVVSLRSKLRDPDTQAIYGDKHDTSIAPAARQRSMDGEAATLNSLEPYDYLNNISPTSAEMFEANGTLDAVLSSVHPLVPSMSNLPMNEAIMLDNASAVRHIREDHPLAGEDLGLLPPAGLELPAQSLPEPNTAQFFVKVYFAFANFSSPLLHQPTFRQKLDLVYSADTQFGVSRSDQNIARFFVHMGFGLGLLMLQKHNPSQFPTLLSDRHYQIALNALRETDLPQDVEGVQALLLIAQYAYLHPVKFGGWNLIGLALRRAVELGLHEDQSDVTDDHLLVDTKRRTFWVAYSLDRNVAIATGRPTGLADTAIAAPVSHVNPRFPVR